MFKLNLKSFLRADFLRKEDGSIAVETVIMLPLLFWTYMAMFSIFDAYRQYSMHQKAAYTISDMISRETLAINDDYLDGAHKLFDMLTRDPQDSAIRVSVLSFDGDANNMVLDWSETRGAATSLDAASVSDWTERLPGMVNAERMIIVETWAKYHPPFKTGLEQREIKNFIFTRPRYSPQLLYISAPEPEPAAA